MWAEPWSKAPPIEETRRGREERKEGNEKGERREGARGGRK